MYIYVCVYIYIYLHTIPTYICIYIHTYMYISPPRARLRGGARGRSPLSLSPPPTSAAPTTDDDQLLAIEYYDMHITVTSYYVCNNLDTSCM